jgi:hypothetical protein
MENTALSPLCALSVPLSSVDTVAATGEVSDGADQPFEPLVLEDGVSDPGEDTARVRLLHASPDAPAVDVTLASSGDAVFDGVAYGGTSTVEVPAGDYTLKVRGDTDGNDGDVVAAYDVSLSGNTVYTAYAAGYLTPDDEPADTQFDLLFTQDTGGMGGDISGSTGSDVPSEVDSFLSERCWTIISRSGSYCGGSCSAVPNADRSSSTVTPGPSVASSKRIPPGPRK